ncbi:hypothetical protein [Nocardia ignorata]|uniref:Uncharacterized protein n=1 Tax=Nocardia ignorata TaxID=145285 RepID=A0A4R6PWI5_NOCIG|nr:hypothetical protein [Nocardia ignorata]TDP43094.1 hypothetical protein DFR75_1012215 [Nocardia ignorata]
MTHDLPLMDLLTEEMQNPGEAEWWDEHEKSADAIVVCFRIPAGRMLLTYWNGQLHKVIYQTPEESEEAAAQRNAYLFAHYGQGHDWTEVVDNGFGKTYFRSDDQLFALWSYAMDYTTVGTKAFLEGVGI